MIVNSMATQPLFAQMRGGGLPAPEDRIVTAKVPLEGNRNVVAKGVLNFRRLCLTARFPRHLGGKVRAQDLEWSTFGSMPCASMKTSGMA